MAVRKASAVDDTGWEKVSGSSNVDWIRHQGAPVNTLFVKFKGSGQRYAWYNVPRSVYLRMKAAASKGKFVHRVLEAQYGLGEKVYVTL